MSPPKKSIVTLLIYLKLYVTVGYYLLIFPFKIIIQRNSVLVDDSIGFRLHFSIRQKVLCGLAYVAAFYHQLFVLVNPRFLEIYPNQGVLSYIEIAQKFVAFIYFFCAISVCWRKQRHFMRIFTTIQALPYGTSPNSKRALILINVGFILIYCWYLYGIPLEFINEFNEYEICLNWNFTSAFHRLQSNARMLFFLNPEAISTETLTFGQAIISLVYLVVYVFSCLIQISLEMLVLVGIVWLWHTTRLFEQWYKKIDYTDDLKPELLVEVLRQYQLLKSLIRTTNKILGPAIVLAIAFLLPFYATFAGLVISSKGNLTFQQCFLLVVYFSIYFTEIMMAAEVNRKGNEFIRWVSSPQFIDSLSSRQLTSLSMDMNSNQMALKGCGFFSLTYRFLTSVLGVLITYSILVVQFRAAPGEYVVAKNHSKLHD